MTGNLQKTKAEKELGVFLANRGIAPFMLASNIALENYSEVSLYKRDGLIVVDMFCTDDETGQPLQFRYKYTEDEVLLTREMIVAGRHSLIWDRSQEESKLVAQLQQQKVSLR